MSFQPVSFGKYELVSRLAAGGMAEIFLARTKGIQGFEKYLVIKRILQLEVEHGSWAATFNRHR